jgi:thiamine biosynthesis lipoprotein
MDLRKKNIVYTLILVGAVVVVYFLRDSGSIPLVTYSGKTMGPIVYNVKYFDEEERNFQDETDSLLKQFNQSLNTYIPTSEISTFNRDSSFRFSLPYFYEVLAGSQRIHEMTGGAYDPTVMPFVNAWGFGPEESVQPDSAYIDSLREFTGFDKVIFNQKSVGKEDRRLALDFSASAKGYGVDVVIEFLAAQGIENAFVEIGGEVRVLGRNLAQDAPWRIGILDPGSTEANQFFIGIVGLENQAMATSGNYFNYRIVDGIRYSHTLNPATGYPEISPILSASVFAETCLEADALATAFMVMGYEKAIEFLETHTEYEAFLIFDAPGDEVSTFATKGIQGSIELIDNE